MPITDEFNDFSLAVTVATSLRQKSNSPAAGLTDDERHLLYEAIFLRIFRAYENLLESVFLSYLTGEPTTSGTQVRSHVSPTDREHARAIVSSAQQFLDWTNPQKIIKRAETYIVTGDPIRTAISSSQSHLQQAKKIRNHIAHNSSESAVDFDSVVQHILLTAPLARPTAGAFLATTPQSGPVRRKEILTFFVEKLESTARALVT